VRVSTGCAGSPSANGTPPVATTRRPFGSKSQQHVPEADVVPLVELPADLWVAAGEGHADGFVEFDAGVVGKCDAGDDGVELSGAQLPKEFEVEGAGDALALELVADVDAGLDGLCVGGAFAPETGFGVASESVIHFGGEPRVGGVLLFPVGAEFIGGDFVVAEVDGGFADVEVGEGGDGGEVGGGGGAEEHGGKLKTANQNRIREEEKGRQEGTEPSPATSKPVATSPIIKA